MPYDVPQLLKMSQAELDALFTQSEAGPIPDGQADGTAIVARVYKDASWLDGKECIVLDYSETSMVAHWIRDEIRLIQPPGLYLGKVYWDKARLIDFSLQF